MFHTFYDYFLLTKSWAYVLMFITLPLYVWYWQCVVNGKTTKQAIKEFLAWNKDQH